MPRVDDETDPRAPQWEEFYRRARALGDKCRCGDPVEFSKDSHTMGVETIEEEEIYGFPKPDDPTLDETCEELSNALQKASNDRVEHDTAEVKQALKNLRKAYDEAAKSNTVKLRYIHAEPPSSPWSPLEGPKLKETLLARSWMKDLIGGLRDKSLRPRLVVIGDSGTGEFLCLFIPLMPSSVCIANFNPGKSVGLVGYLLFYFIAQGERIILQSTSSNGRLGFIFDCDGVRQVFSHNAETYNDGQSCYLLVNADGPSECPLGALSFCDKTVVVTSPNLKGKPALKNWQKQALAEPFVAPPPSSHEVVYLLYVELFK